MLQVLKAQGMSDEELFALIHHARIEAVAANGRKSDR